MLSPIRGQLIYPKSAINNQTTTNGGNPASTFTGRISITINSIVDVAEAKFQEYLRNK